MTLIVVVTTVVLCLFFRIFRMIITRVFINGVTISIFITMIMNYSIYIYIYIYDDYDMMILLLL